MPDDAAQPGSATADAEPSFPYPPRYWWLKRVSLSCLVLAVVLSVAWKAWDREARRRLDRAQAPILAEGFPLSAAALEISPVPADKNGALLYLEAGRLAESIKAYSPASSQMTYADYPPLPPRWHRTADWAAEKNQPVFRLMRRARAYDRFDWGVRVPTPTTGALLPHLEDTRNLANLIGDAALHAHLNGDDAAALEYARDVLHLADAVDAPPQFTLSHLVATGIRGVVLYRLGIIAQDLTVAPAGAPEPGQPPEPAPRPVRRPASQAQVRALIAGLLDDRTEIEALRGSFAGERAGHVDMTEWFGQNAPLLRPMFRLDAVRVLKVSDVTVRAAGQPDFQAMRDTLKDDPDYRQNLPPQTNLRAVAGWGRGRGGVPKRRPVDHTRLMTSDVTPALASAVQRVVEQSVRNRADARLKAAMLAVQLYRADHGGALPADLAALVPKYLPAPPADPFAADGRPVGYVIARGALPAHAGGGDRPLVYSVGPDGVDDTVGRGLPPLPDVPIYDWAKGHADQLRDVLGWPAPPPNEPDPQEAEEERRWKDPANPDLRGP